MLNAPEIIKNNPGPIMVNYRINAGNVPADSWVQDKYEGGGRIIGEACHFFDLINYFIEDDVVDVKATHIPVDNNNIVANDNFISTIKYKNGSVASVVYTSLGNKDLPKEYIEVFVNGKSMIIDDFRELKLFGLKSNGVKLKYQNKGHEEQIVEFIKKIKGKNSSLLTLAESSLAARIAIQVDTLLS